MQRHDVVVIGGGPAGSTCARALRRAGADVVVIDRARFPRDKVCAGWITPAVVRALELDLGEYRAAGLRLQEITAFRTSVIGTESLETRFDAPVSFAIRRCEFDDYLLRRSGARVLEASAVTDLRRHDGGWLANGAVYAPVVVGAAGHFCPVARSIGRTTRRQPVVARRLEMLLANPDRCAVGTETPELFFSRDLDGYGWCIRNGDYLNVGIGRRARQSFGAHVREFAEYLAASGRVPSGALDWTRWRGHAYLLRDTAGSVGAEGALLVGDAAGLAARESGEGIGPAVQSARLAAQIIIGSAGRIRREQLERYRADLAAMSPAGGLGATLRAGIPAAVGRMLLRVPAFTRSALERWFLRVHEDHSFSAAEEAA